MAVIPLRNWHEIFDSRACFRRHRGLRSLAILALCLQANAARAAWTFCVAESSGGKDIWITSVFASARDRERLEADFLGYLKAHGVVGPVAQCPLPKDDKTDMVNAQIVAVEFHRKLGDALHEVGAAEFELKR